MKQVFTIIALFICAQIYAGVNIFTLDKGKVMAKSQYVNKLYVDKYYKHDNASYKLTDSVIVNTNNDYWYEVKSYMFVDDEYDYMADTTFCRLDIVCHAKRNTKGSDTSYVFINDNRWLRFNHGGFGFFTKYWEDSANIMFKQINVSKDIVALAFRGFRDSAGLPELSVFILKGRDITLVYNKEVDVSEIIENNGMTTYILQDNWFRDDEEEFIPHLVKMVFGNGTITIE